MTDFFMARTVTMTLTEALKEFPVSENAPTYDRYGRMQYHPAYHPNQKKTWMNADQKYLIENYVIDGPEAVSLALGRTIHTVMQRACQLRREGVMPKKPAKMVFHKRMGSIR
jgi:hypothetical protein